REASGRGAVGAARLRHRFGTESAGHSRSLITSCRGRGIKRAGCAFLDGAESDNWPCRVAPQGGAVPSEYRIVRAKRARGEAESDTRPCRVAPQGGAVPSEHLSFERSEREAKPSPTPGRAGRRRRAAPCRPAVPCSAA